MQRINLKEDKALAFILGVLYGYRNTQIELKILPLEEFSEEKHTEDRVYYLNRREGKLYRSFQEDVTHICVLREDAYNRKVSVFVYRRSIVRNS